ncbi:hypothetical protein OIO90_001015 [Microbotryomycetes sp. JL221]|nr:hypothetical protein OIO90_001015 [Microbotryomycetes sp. JL221]
MHGAEQQLFQKCCELWGQTTWPLCLLSSDSSNAACAVEALQAAYQREYDTAVRKIRQAVHDRVCAARQLYEQHSALAASLPTIPASARGTFTDDVTAILIQAWTHQPHVTRAERKVLSDVTGLNDKQIRTWFGNQRSRKGTNRKRGTSTTAQQRSTPYNGRAAATPPRPTSNFLRPKLRDFSGTSSSSFGSDDSDRSDASTAPSSVYSWLDGNKDAGGQYYQTAQHELSSPESTSGAQLQFGTRLHHQQPAVTLPEGYTQQEYQQQSFQQELSPLTPALQLALEQMDGIETQSTSAQSPDILEQSSIFHPSHDRSQQSAYTQPTYTSWMDQAETQDNSIDPTFVPLLPNFDFESEQRDEDFWNELTKASGGTFGGQQGLNELFDAIVGQEISIGLPQSFMTNHEEVNENRMHDWNNGPGINVMLPLQEGNGFGGFWKQA